MLIGFAGRKQAGKDTAAVVLTRSGWTKLSFADQLKFLCEKCCGLTKSQTYLQCEKEKPFETPYVINRLDAESMIIGYIVQGYNVDVHPAKQKECIDALTGLECFTPRDMLQKVGSTLRSKLWHGIWVDLLFCNRKPVVHEVITDCRYENEREAIQRHGGAVFYIDRPSLPHDDSHESENSFGPLGLYDGIIVNDGSIKDLHAKVAALVVEKGIVI